MNPVSVKKGIVKQNMQIITTGSAYEDTALHISNLINTYHGDTLCFLAGGSALEMYEYLHISEPAKGRTIFCMGDERVSGEAEINNFLQLQSTAPEFSKNHTIVNSSLQVNETRKLLTKRINFKLEKIFSETKKLQIIVILGMGEDGHTAGIFPTSDVRSVEWFKDTYEADSTYVPVHHDSLTIDSRASITPAVIKNADHAVVFITGEAKKAQLAKLAHKNIPVQEMPIQIIKTNTDAVVFTDIQLP